MTEAEWLACTNPKEMLEFLRSSGKANARKLKLLALAYLRWAALHYSSPLTEDALRAAEAKAEGEKETSERLGQGWIAAGSLLKEATTAAERAVLCSLLRDLFGNPLRLAPFPDPSWLAWRDGVVVKLAQAIYPGRAFDRLPVLADALEEAGCHDPDILAHCRQPGEHVRGCWLVDLLLGKE
jgi:hypothetical protein